MTVDTQTFETLKVEFLGEDQEVLVVTLNRPDVMNARNTKMLEERLALFREQAYNETLRCIVITGAGDKAFSAGGDLKERNGMGNNSWKRQHQIIEDLVLLTRDFPVPIIAAVEGYALAGGCELALSTDFIIASETAVFGLSEALRGILPGGGGLQNLARAIGVRRAKEVIYTGRKLNAELAYEWGLVNEVVPKGQAKDKAIEIAFKIAASAPMAVRAAKVSINNGSETDYHSAYALDIAAYNLLVTSEDRLEGVAAFNEKRKPNWQCK